MKRMKKLVICMLLAMLCITQVVTIQVVAVESNTSVENVNLIGNPSFENIKNYTGTKDAYQYWKNKVYPDKWTGIWIPNAVDSNTNYMEVIDSNAIEGEKSVLFHSEDMNTRFSINQELVYDGEEDVDTLFSYEAKVKVRELQAEKGVYLRLQCMDKNGVSLKQIESNVIKTYDSDIQKLYLETQIPEDTYKLRFVIFFDKAIGEVEVDDVMFKIADTITLEDTEISLLEGEKTTVHAITSADEITWESSNDAIAYVNENDEIVAKSTGEATITATIPNGKSASCIIKVINKFMVNMLEDGSFEEESVYTGNKAIYSYWKNKVYPKGWDNLWVPSQPEDTTTGLQLVNENAYDGDRAIKFNSNDKNARFCIFKVVENLVEDTDSYYQFTLKVKLQNVEVSKKSAGVYIRVQFLDEKSNKIDLIKSTSMSGTTDDYETLEVIFQIPEQTKSMKFEIFFEYMTGEAYIDDAQFTLSDSIHFDEESISLNIGDEITLKPKYQDDSVVKNTTWSSSNSKVVSVDESGNLIALKPGTALITSKLNDDREASVKVIVLGDYEEYYDLMKEKWVNRLTGNDLEDKTDENYLKTMQSVDKKATTYYTSMNNPTITNSDSIWDDLDLQYQFIAASDTKLSQDYGEAFSRVRSMALAYACEGSQYYKNQNLKESIEVALQWLYDNLYNEQIDIENKLYGNWWHWQIGIPQDLCEILVLMADDIDNELYEKEILTLQHFNADPTYVWTVNGRGKNEMTGANLTDRAYISVLTGVLAKDYHNLYQGIEALQSALTYVEEGDGFYQDGSFIQHKYLAYTAGYGASLIIGIENILFTINDTPYALDQESISTVYEWILNGYKPLFAYGAIMDMTAGRGIARPTRKDQTAGRSILVPIAMLIDLAEDDVKEELSKFVKEQVLQGILYNSNYLSGIDMIASQKIKHLINDDTIDISQKESYTHIYSSMDKVTHHTQSFSLGISMFSSRTSAFEYGNYENKKGYHMSDGVLFLYNGDQSQFADDFYQTVDYMRLPGTTTDHTEVTLKAWQPYYSSKSFVGGSSVLGKYASIAMDYDALESTLEAKKSWFLFEDEVVALGAGISSDEDTFIETIVENRKIKDDNSNTFIVNGIDMTTVKESSIENVKWAFLDGNTGSDTIGYYFPDEQTSINILREARTGNWTSVNDNIDLNSTYAKDTTKNYLSIAIPHSKKAQDETYSYVLLPNNTEEEVEEYANNPTIKILSNTSKIQAVMHTKLNITGITFWEEGEINGITSKSQSSVTLAKTESFVEIGIADPSMENEKTIIEVDKAHLENYTSVEADDTITVKDLGDTVYIEVLTKNTSGKTHTVKFYK